MIGLLKFKEKILSKYEDENIFIYKKINIFLNINLIVLFCFLCIGLQVHLFASNPRNYYIITGDTLEVFAASFSLYVLSKKKLNLGINILAISYFITIICHNVIGDIFIHQDNPNLRLIETFISMSLWFSVIGLCVTKKIYSYIYTTLGLSVFVLHYFVLQFTCNKGIPISQLIIYFVTLLLFGYLSTLQFNLTNEAIDNLLSTKVTKEKLIKKCNELSVTTNNSVEKLADMIDIFAQGNKEVALAVSNVSDGNYIQIEKANVGLEAGRMLSKNSEDIKNNADIMKKSAIEVINKSEKGTESITNLLSIQEENQNNMKSVEDIVSKLIDKIKEVNKFSDTIISVSKETQLLALNASIEAAKAGEDGRGFSVIAKNIKKLAEQTDLKAKEIQSTLLGIMNISNDTANKLNLTNESSETQNEIVKETVEIFKSLKGTITISISEINNVYNKINELMQIRDIVIKSIDEVSKVTKSNSVISEEVCATIEEQLSQIGIIKSYTVDLKEESMSLTKVINEL